VLLEPSSTAPVGPLPAQQRTGLAAQRLLSDRTEAERAFQLAERLGSVNAAAAELGTTWPSLRKAFTRHGLGMPTPNPEAVRQRVIEAARQRSPRPATPSLDPVFVARNQGELPVRARSGGELAERVRWAEDYAALGAGVVVEQHSESTPASPAPAPGRSPATPSVATATRPTANSAATATVGAAPTAPTDPTNPRGGWLPMLGGAAVSRRPGRPPDSLPLDQLADLLSELPNRQQPLGLGVPMVGVERAAARRRQAAATPGSPARARGGAARYGS
jgi:hypothetical protein